MTDEIQSNLEALSEDEGLTDNLTDEPAQALLAWAAQHIKAGLDLPSVRRAVRAANRDEIASPEAAVAAASAALRAGASAAAAAPPAAQPPAPSPPALDAAVQRGVATGQAQAAQRSAAPAQMLKDALDAARKIGAQGQAAATARPTTPATAGRGRQPKHQARRRRQSRFSTRRP